MSKFLVTKKQLEDVTESSKSKLLVSNRHTEISDSDLPQFSTIKTHIETKVTVTVSFDSQGGSSAESNEYILGQTYSELPTSTKTQHILTGWFTDPENGIQITEDSIVSLDVTILYAHWEYVEINVDNCTSYTITTTSSYKNTGIYTASISNSANPIYIDWGDGSVEKTYSSISQKSHTYSSVGTFTVKISDNITSFAPSYSNSTWYNTTSSNRYTFKGMISTGSKVVTLPTYAFYYCVAMTNIDFMETCWTSVTSIPNQCFYYCSGLTDIQGAKRFTSIGSQTFRYCTGLSGVQDLSEFKFTTLPNSYTFANCTNVTEWILPETFSGTAFGSYMFANNSKLIATSIPNSLTSISPYCFQNCTSLITTTIPSKVISIGNYAYSGCTKLATVNNETIALTAIGNNAFYNNYALESLQLPDTVKSIGQYAFYQCYDTNATTLDLPSSLTSLGEYAYYYCYSLKNLTIPSALTSINNYAFSGCRNLSGIADYRLTAQTTYAYTFGSAVGTGATAYTGYSTRGNNNLSVYFTATGYDESYWQDPLQNPDKCGFNLTYLDPENIKYCTIIFDAGNGSIAESTSTVIQTKKYGTLPTPTCPADQPYFGGWYTGEDGSGEKITAESIVPSQNSITLYALYSATPFASYIVDLNGQWRESSVANPDSSLYNGVYESYSNYNVSNGWAKMKINITGYTDFTIYIRSYGESSHDYTLAFNLDVEPTSNPLSSSSGVKAHTSGNQQSGTAISNYTKVEYTEIDGGEHFICVVYRKDGSTNRGNDRGYLLIEKSGDESILVNPGEYDPDPNYTQHLCFTAEEDGSTISMIKGESAPEVLLRTTADGQYWKPFIPGETVINLAQVGDKIYFKAGEGGNNRFCSTSGTTVSYANYFSMIGKIAASGNIMSLLNGEEQITELTEEDNSQCFTRLFYNCKSLTTAPALPATTLASSCYSSMFRDCTSLTSAPALPATTLTNHCYSNMFYGCTSLISAPALPATTLASSCYYYMFRGCTSLTSAPALPATTLADSCYLYMFRGCTSLTSAPALPATILVKQCYGCMFYGCTNLNSISVNFFEWRTLATSGWLDNVSSSGTFICPAELPETRGTSYIPTNWTIERTPST